MRAVVSLLLIVTLLAASLPLAASVSRRACCRTQSSCPMKQHHTSGCAIRCGVSAPAPRAVAAIRDVPLMPSAIALPLPHAALLAFEATRATHVAYAAPPPTPPPL